MALAINSLPTPVSPRTRTEALLPATRRVIRYTSFIAGELRVRFSVFLVLTAIGKGARYAVLLLVYTGYLQVIS